MYTQSLSLVSWPVWRTHKRWTQIHLMQSEVSQSLHKRPRAACSSGRFWFPTHKDAYTLFIFETRHQGRRISLWTLTDKVLQCCTSAVCLTKMHWNILSPRPIRFIPRPIGGSHWCPAPSKWHKKKAAVSRNTCRTCCCIITHNRTPENLDAPHLKSWHSQARRLRITKEDVLLPFK